MLGRRTWKWRRSAKKKRIEFHIPPSVSLPTVTRVLSALRAQGLLAHEEGVEWVLIPLTNSRHMYHKEHGDI